MDPPKNTCSTKVSLNISHIQYQMQILILFHIQMIMNDNYIQII